MQEESQQNLYSLIAERQMINEVIRVEWSNSMDLCAVLLINNIIEIYRISFKVQKVHQLQENDNISSMKFNQNSSLFCYTTESSLVVMNLNNLSKIISNYYNDGFQPSSFWIGDYRNKQLQDTISLPQSVAICPVHITQQEIMTHLKFLKSNQLSQIIWVWNESGNIKVSLNSLLDLIDLKTDLNILQVIPNKDYKQIHILNIKEGKLFLDVYNTDLLSNLGEEIHSQGTNLVWIKELFQFLKISVGQLIVHLKDIIKVFNQNIVFVLDEFYRKNPLNQNVQIHQELLRFLRFGVCSQEIQTFLNKELNDTKILQKIDEKISTSYLSIQDLIAESCLNVLQLLSYICQQTIGLNNNLFYRQIELNQQDLDNFQNLITQLSQIIYDIQIEVTESKMNIKNFLVWLNRSDINLLLKNQDVIKTLGENENETENVKSPLFQYKPDIARLNKFLENSQLFYLKNLSQFFDDSQKIQTNNLELIQQQLDLYMKKIGKEATTTDNPNIDLIFNKIKEKFKQNYKDLTDKDFKFQQNNSIGMNIKNSSFQVEENPKLNMSQNIKQMEKLFKSIQESLSLKISQSMSKVKCERLGNVDTRFATPKISINVNGTYKIGFLESEDKIIEINVTYQPFIFERKEYSLKKQEIYDISFDQSDNLVAIIKQVSYQENEMIQEKIQYLVSQLSLEDDYVELGQQYVVDGSKVHQLNISGRGLISVVSDDKKIIVLC